MTGTEETAILMWSVVFWFRPHCRPALVLVIGVLEEYMTSIFDHEDEGDMFLRNVSKPNHYKATWRHEP
jgi:hypothetical protein